MRKLHWMIALALAMWGMQIAAARVPEHPQFRLLGVRDGIPSTTINAIERDALGFVWVGSSDGLARYDGHAFRIWRHDPGDAFSLPGNIVQALHVDARNRLWVASEFSGLGMLDTSRTRVVRMRRETHPALASNDIYAIISRGDELWLGTANAGLLHMKAQGNDPAGWQLQAISGLPSQTVLALAFDAQGMLWIATTRGLVRWDGKHVHKETIAGLESPGMVYSVLYADGQLWVGTEAGVFCREGDGRWRQPLWSTHFRRPNAAVAMARDADGTMWIGSQRGLWWVRTEQSVPQSLTLMANATPHHVGALHLQADGGLWVSVPGGGMGYLRSDWRSIAEFGQNQPGERQIGATSYRALARARAGGVWAAGADGHIERLDAQGVVARQPVSVREALAGTKPMSVLEDELGQLWLGEPRMGLIRIDANGQMDTWRDDHAQAPLPSGVFIDLLQAGRGQTLWLSMQAGGLQQRDIRTGRVLRQVLPGMESGLGDGDNEALRLSPDGRLWVAGGFGLGWLDEQSNRLVIPPGLAGERVFAFDFENADALWLHRLTGLEYWQKRAGQWQLQTQVHSGKQLPAVETGSLWLDSHKRVWFSSQRGLFRWDPVRRHLRSYGMANGLTSQAFMDRAMVLSAEGALVLSSNAGKLVMLDTRFPEPAAHAPQLWIDGVDVRKDGRWISRMQAGTMPVFAPSEREIRITAHLNAYDDSEAIRYWSWLEGLDEGWVEQGAEGERIFSGLPAGRYTLRMRGQDPSGNVSDTVTLAFRVRPPWWYSSEAWGAYAVVLLLLSLASGMAWRQRVRRRHELHLAVQKRRLSEQASEAKTRFLANLGHEIRTPMTGVLGMAELLQASDLDARQRQQLDAICKAGRHLLRLVNDALDLARIEAGRLVLAEDPFDVRQLVQDVADLMQSLALQKHLAFQLQMAPDTPHWLTGDRTRVEQILLNLLGNAIKFTTQGEVIFRVARQMPQGLHVEVRDSGPGLSPDQQARIFQRFEQLDDGSLARQRVGSGLGLAISAELAEMMGGRIVVDSRLGEGATFHLHLPLPEASPIVTPAPSTAIRDEAARCRVLLVEDDETVAEVIVGLLQAQGHQVQHVAHALDALVAASASDFDLFLLDLDLPSMSGLDLARQLRQQGLTAPLVAVTARADSEVEPQALAAGFDAFIRKPLTGELLNSLVHRVLTDARRKVDVQGDGRGNGAG